MRSPRSVSDVVRYPSRAVVEMEGQQGRGFEFQRSAPGEDGALVGSRVTGDWVDLIHIEGFSRDCFAWRKRASSLIVPGDGLVENRVHGSALTVLNEVLTWESGA